MSRLRAAPIWAVAAGVLAGAWVGVGLAADDEPPEDVDRPVFEQTLRDMQDGEGYYEAFADALVVKEGARPSQLRSLRLPTMYLLLWPVPEGLWRWVAGIPVLATLLLVGALAAPVGERAATAAVCTAAVWLLPSAAELYLHAELWGAPLLLGAALLRRRRRSWGSAALAAGAVAIRELFALGLGAGLLLDRKRWPWVGACAAAGVLAVVHVVLGSDVLDPAGTETGLDLREPPLDYLAPGRLGAGGLLGAVLVIAGVAGCWRRRRVDDAAPFLLLAAAPLVVAGIVAGRSYWSLTWSSALAAFAPAAVVGLRRSNVRTGQ